ncbi:DUF3014 domain-containing protein [Alteromonas sp. ASW11-19]|uniref:DUF3014 domain-containing protein n=1 Tax=Alteromonas salexigens TaxID=2982530 RepID=A0ABT2VK78_9ALTE|nr:DUF3014 domain-containing protein [Alteromonas salexigens]MCU7553579.1 DUF3014 domain-containing protein [Alteromonas salexigens]
MSEESEKRTLTPHILIIGAVVIVILAVLFWPSGDDTDDVSQQPEVTEPEMQMPDEPEVIEPAPAPSTVELDPDAEAQPMPETPEIEPEPLDTSDVAIKEALAEVSQENKDEVNRILVNEALLQRFVVSVTNLADDKMAPNHQLVTPPEQPFRTYTQADKEWIDAASYKRYTPYVNMLESFDNEALLNLYDTYKGDIQKKYAEIGDPDQPFNDVMVDAINQLLDTPEVPMPVEVYTDSVAYKFADPKLESLSEPQKQLLRTGPDNMRRIKAKLREIKAVLQENGYQ